MKLDSNLAHHRTITRAMDGGKLARRAPLSRSHDAIVAATLLALLVVAIVTRATIGNEIADSEVDRQSYVAFVIDVVLSIGRARLLLSSRPRADDEGARS